MLDRPLASALLEALPEQAPAAAWLGDPTSSGQSDRGHPLRIRSARSNAVWLGEAAITLTTTLQHQGAIAAVAKSLRRGSPGRARQLEQLGAQRQNLLAGLRAPSGWPLNSRCACQKQREEAGPTRQGFQPRRGPGSAAAGTPCLLQLEAFVVLSPPAARPWGTEEPIGLLLEDQGGARCRLLAEMARRFFAPAPARRGWPMAMSAWSWQQPQAEQVLFPGLGGNNQQKTCRLVHPALLEGAEAAFA